MFFTLVFYYPLQIQLDNLSPNMSPTGYFCSKSIQNVGVSIPPHPTNDKEFALDPFRYYICLNIIFCSIYQIQKLHAVVIRKLISLTTKIIVQQRKLITMILPLFLDFPLPYEAHSCGLTKIRRKVRDYSLLKQFLKKAT